MGKTHWSGPLIASNQAMGGAAEELAACVCDGESAGRMVFHALWLTPAALPQTIIIATQMEKNMISGFHDV